MNERKNRLAREAYTFITDFLMLTTEALGAGILTDLRGQREQIVYTRNTLLEADSNIDKSSRTLKAMARRMATNKLITASIIGVLVFLILFVLYRKIFH
ncbi:hypothetical protein BGZ51_002311 [Haplosporangium sp. Z 767]|nr:hypothetical protein BGZ51_002311 [Haplosporangium sp. Z 767]